METTSKRLDKIERLLAKIMKELKPKQKRKVRKPRKAAIPKVIKTLVWNKYIGEDVAVAKCVCCETIEIRNTHFHCGHVIAEADGGTLEISNLRPVCAPCNLSMGTRNMDEFRETFGLGSRKRKRTA